VEAAPLHGSVGHAILARADSWNATMIVMGSYEHSRERELLLGGTTRRVIANARCAVALAK
jgi:nucleotide-binding universal stress UspA family protein